MAFTNIKFICYDPKDTITCDDRKAALNLIRKGNLRKYRTVVVDTGNDRFNLDSPRGKEYFGIKER